jgi:hypothetical protein
MIPSFCRWEKGNYRCLLAVIGGIDSFQLSHGYFFQFAFEVPAAIFWNFAQDSVFCSRYSDLV